MKPFTKKTITSSILFSTIVASILSLVGCGGSDGLGGTGITPVVQGTLVRSDDEKLSTYFHNAIKQSSTNTFNSAPTNASADGAEGGSVNSFSSTNIQESGVDEADLVKTDGRYIYSIKRTSNGNIGIADGPSESSSLPAFSNAQSDVIRIMDTQNSGGITEVKSLSGSNDAPWQIAGLYLHQVEKRLVALTSPKRDYYADWFYSESFAKQETKVLLIDVSTPETSKISSTLSFDGQLISSRRNGDTLYMILRHYPDYQYVDDQKLENTTASDFLPRYSVDNGAKQLITQPNNCYVEADKNGTADVITLVAIDLKSSTHQINSQCFVGSTEALYASKKALYLATTRWDYQANNGLASYSSKVTTDIHKFNYTGLNFDYRGSAEIEGHLGYNQDSKSFRFSESDDGKLRVITVDEDQWGLIGLPVDAASTPTGEAAADAPSALAEENKSPVSLTILEEDSTKNALKIISKLPNNSRPQPIGLPDEKLYATRYIGNRAFIITFRVTDPLYIIDLNNPSDPFIAGELKVNGYSDYLHPITENLLMGIGKDAIPSNAGDNSRGAWYQGVKLSLIDITDPGNPREADKVIIGKRGTETAVLTDHHAFTGLQAANNYRVAIPVQLHDGEPSYQGNNEPASVYYNYTHTGLYRFEIDTAAQKINQIPAMIVSESEATNVGSIYEDRSIFINDDVYYIHEGHFWSQDWRGTESILGPK